MYEYRTVRVQYSYCTGLQILPVSPIPVSQTSRLWCRTEYVPVLVLSTCGVRVLVPARTCIIPSRYWYEWSTVILYCTSTCMFSVRVLYGVPIILEDTTYLYRYSCINCTVRQIDYGIPVVQGTGSLLVYRYILTGLRVYPTSTLVLVL